MLAPILFNVLPTLPGEQLLGTLPSWSTWLFELILWLAAVGVGVATITTGFYSLAWCRMRLTQARVVKPDYKPTLWGTPRAWRYALNEWAHQKRIRPLTPGMAQEVVDLALVRYRDAGFLTQFPRAAILCGLIGTLIGLIQAVESVFIDVQALESIESLREPLKATLSGLGAAFLTTFVGVGAALILTPLILLARWARLAALHKADTVLSTRLLPACVSTESDLALQLSQLAEAASQKVMAEKITETVSVASAGLNSLAARLVAAVDSAREGRAGIAGVAEGLETTNEKLAKLSETLETQLKALLEKMDRSAFQNPSATTSSSDIRREVAKLIERQRDDTDRLIVALDSRGRDIRELSEGQQALQTTAAIGIDRLEKSFAPLKRRQEAEMQLAAALDTLSRTSDAIFGDNHGAGVRGGNGKSAPHGDENAELERSLPGEFELDPVGTNAATWAGLYALTERQVALLEQLLRTAIVANGSSGVGSGSDGATTYTILDTPAFTPSDPPLSKLDFLSWASSIEDGMNTLQRHAIAADGRRWAKRISTLWNSARAAEER